MRISNSITKETGNFQVDKVVKLNYLDETAFPDKEHGSQCGKGMLLVFSFVVKIDNTSLPV